MSIKMAGSQAIRFGRSSGSPSEIMEAEARKTKRMAVAAGSGGPGALERAPSCRASAWLDLRSGYSAALHRMRESKRNFTSATYFGTASSYF